MIKEKVYIVTATYNDFDKSGGSMIMWNCDEKDRAWKLAFYELWRVQMTWSFAYSLEVIDGRDNLFIEVVCKEAFLENLINTMEGVGFRNIKSRESNVGLVNCLKVPDDVCMLDIDW